MLQKKYRLAKTKDIQITLARGRNFFSPYLSIKFLPRPSVKRLTVVVSTKVFKNAVARNRLKRVLREQLRKNLQQLPFGDYLIMTKPKISGIPESQASRELSALINKIR